MQNTMLISYNTCGILRRENEDFYIAAIEEILSSGLEGLRVVFSSCLNGPDGRMKVQNYFGDRISYNFIDEVLPVNVTFNHTVLESVKRFGEFNCYVFWDSGCRLRNPNDLNILYNNLIETNAGMLSPVSSIDAHYAYGLKLATPGDDAKALSIMFANSDNYIVPDGRACGAHVNLIHNDLFKYYNRVCPDIFGGYCTESIFSFLCGALKKNWIITARAVVQHYQSMDGTSSGFTPTNNGHPEDYGFRIKNVLPIFKNEKAISLGLGYEECENVVVHDSSQFDSNYHCINDELKDYIRDNLFLSNELMDYTTIKGTYIE